MSFTLEQGYVPSSFQAIMNSIREGINQQFNLNYTAESFVGTNFYKFYYPLVQRMQRAEITTSEVFIKLQQYFIETNQRISRSPLTNQGVVEFFAANGYVASVKNIESEDAGNIFLCVDVDDQDDDYEVKKVQIANLMKSCVAGGVVSNGTEEQSVTLSNGQSFDYKFDLPNKLNVWLRLTIAVSDNNLIEVLSPEDVREILIQNIQARYRLGLNFEPQKYIGINEIPWASSFKLEYSIGDDQNFTDDVYVSDHDDLFVFLNENVSIVEE